MMKYLIVGLGNIGDQYAHTRHNIGFDIVDNLALSINLTFDENKRYGAVAEGRIKNKQILILKPSTYMNESGKAVRYWLQKEKIDVKNLLVVLDDLALPLGTIRLRGKGADAGHNGLKNIDQMIETQQYARLRFGIGNDFPRGSQIDYVLGTFSSDEQEIVSEKISKASDAIKSFCLEGLAPSMNKYNNK